MKKITIALLVVLGMGSCRTDYRVSSKSYVGFWGQKLPDGICRILYDDDNKWTEDSCNKYQVGDTVKH